MDKLDDRVSAWLVYGALVAVQVFFGLNYLAAKVVLRELEPQALAVLRVVGAAIVLWLVARATGRRLPSKPADLGRLALYAIFGVVLNQVLFIEGLSRTTPTHSSLINTTIPVVTLLLAVLAGREAYRARKLMAPLLAMIGVVLVIRPDVAGLIGSTVLGDLLTLSNATSFSLFLVLSKPLLARTDALGATTVLFFFGAFGIGLIGLPEILAADLGAVSLTSWGLMLYIVVFPTAVAYLLQYWALAKVDSSVVAFFIYLQPLVATTLSILFFDERPALSVYLGGALIFAAVYVALHRNRPDRGGQP